MTRFGGIHRSLAALPLSLLCSALAGCDGPTISAIHDPLYTAAPHTSNIRVSAGASRGTTIVDISVLVIVGEATACTEYGWPPSVIPCRRNATSQTLHCPAGVTSCALPVTLGDGSLVSYTATATDSSGSTASTPWITYAGGASPTQTSTAGGATIPWEIARPAYWHTPWPLGTKSPDYLNVVFFPDATDFGFNYPAFNTAMLGIATAAHFNATDPYANLYSSASNAFNLWAGPGSGATGSMLTPLLKCDAETTGLAANIAAVSDGWVVVHDTYWNDCSHYGPHSGGTVYDHPLLPDGKPFIPPETYTHESGHFLHGLADEYACDGGHSPTSVPPNVFTSEDNCKKAATAESFVAPSACKEMKDRVSGMSCSPALWRLDTTQPDIMTITTDRNAMWRGFSGRVVTNRIIACKGGTCF